MRKHVPTLTALLIAGGLTFSNAHAQNTAPYWSLSGNSNATTSSKLGTTTQTPLYLTTNNTTRVYISPKVGYVGIGTTNPLGKLFVLNNGSAPATVWTGSGTPLFGGFGENTSGNADFFVSMASYTASARPVFIGKRSRGTLATPTIVANNDYLASLRGSGYDGSTFQNSAALEFLVDGNPASGSVPTRISFATGSNSSNRTERLRIGSNGDIALNSNQLFVQKATGNIGIGTSSPASMYKLDVRGLGRFTNGIGVDSGNIVVSSGTIGVSNNEQEGTALTANSNEHLENTLGIFASGATAVRGVGSEKGIAAYSETGYGMYSEGGYAGLYALSTDSRNYGVICQGNVGINAFGNQYGIYAGVPNTGSTGTYAGYFFGSVYTTCSYLPSARKLKKDITEIASALTLINKLQPKQYEYRQDGDFALMNLPKGKRYGLVAEDLEQVLPNLVKETEFDTHSAQPNLLNLKPGVNQNTQTNEPTTTKINFKAVNYTELIPIVIKGMQELNEKTEKENTELKEQLAAQQQQIDELKQLVNRLTNGQTTTNISGAFLEQNTPNPVSGTTVIRYHVPEAATAAHLTLTDAKGQLVKTITLNRNSSQFNLNTSMLAAGTYNYTLFVDGKQTDTKRLVIARQ